MFGFLGPNGAGKSTTIRLLLGLARPTAGRAWIFDTDAQDVRTAHRSLAYVPADVALWPQLTGAEILDLLGRTGPGVDRAYRDELVERFALDLSKPGRTYSTGNRQKVALVAAFATRAPLLVLDEPTSGLDPLMEREFQRAVAQARERGQTVFLSSHQLAEVEAVCDRVAILRAGRLVEVADVADLRRLHRTEVEVTFAGTAPQLAGVPGVETVEAVGPARLRFTLTGPPAPALRALAGGRRDGPGGSRTDARGDLPRLLQRGVPVTTVDARTPPTAAVAVYPAAGRAVTWLAVRQVRRGAVIVILLVAGMSALVAATYASTVGDAWTPPPSPRWPRTPRSVPCSANRSPSTPRAGSPCGAPARSSPSWSACGACSRPPGSPAARRTPAAGTCCWPDGSTCPPS